MRHLCRNMQFEPFRLCRSVDKFPRIKFPEECWHCDSCVLDCPVGAISLRIPLSYGLMHVDASTLTTKEVKS